MARAHSHRLSRHHAGCRQARSLALAQVAADGRAVHARGSAGRSPRAAARHPARRPRRARVADICARSRPRPRSSRISSTSTTPGISRRSTAAARFRARPMPSIRRREDYLVHITTGTHVAQICLFLLTEARYLPGRLLQTQPAARRAADPVGTWNVIDLDLSRYDSIATRFAEASSRTAPRFLKSGIETRNAAFNRMIDEIEQVAVAQRRADAADGADRRRQEPARAPHLRAEASAPSVCRAVRRGELRDAARRQRDVGAVRPHARAPSPARCSDRAGLLRSADGGMLFLDEIGELGLDEQAMILRAVEERRFLPVGSRQGGRRATSS